MAGIIFEGGTFRPIFSAGVMDALLEKEIMFPYCIGVSAGISFGVSYISKQKGRNLEVLLNCRKDKRYISTRNLIKCRSLFGLDFVYDEVPNKLFPFDWDTFFKYEGKALVGVTNAETGKAEYLNAMDTDKRCTILQATCAMPLFFPAINWKGGMYYDGGLADSIPIRKAIEDGNEKNLIVLTRPKGYRRTLGRDSKLAMRLLRNKYPAMVEVIRNRPDMYNETVAFCEELEREGKAVILRPEYTVESMEKDLAALERNYKHGYDMAMNHIDEIKKLLV
ncbi:patatin-like phospholipase family protein [Anaerocolumna xylanovorans]|uniref:Predicted phospholipase, patatin/cPLA2 family n=1 Tax=Anaerocolumna xylanovorans DSM 12503 TaxID=1121345 RepID=A0A1M7Y128_9FIRM|nr:patatin family protein [Anaerocolumna xylanovorans]SHO45144.1 Predicted phospholipase, patatin/cPLA2 family [Anaerocolumna xylanovorans DSM 12503]